MKPQFPIRERDILAGLLIEGEAIAHLLVCDCNRKAIHSATSLRAVNHVAGKQVLLRQFAAKDR